jgi:hypothetical protein
VIFRGVLLPCEKKPAGYLRIGAIMYLVRLHVAETLVTGKLNEFFSVLCFVIRKLTKCFPFVKRKYEARAINFCGPWLRLGCRAF